MKFYSERLAETSEKATFEWLFFIRPGIAKLGRSKFSGYLRILMSDRAGTTAAPAWGSDICRNSATLSSRDNRISNMNSKHLLAAVALVVALAFAAIQPDMRPIFVNLGLTGITIQTK